MGEQLKGRVLVLVVRVVDLMAVEINRACCDQALWEIDEEILIWIVDELAMVHGIIMARLGVKSPPVAKKLLLWWCSSTQSSTRFVSISGILWAEKNKDDPKGGRGRRIGTPA